MRARRKASTLSLIATSLVSEKQEVRRRKAVDVGAGVVVAQLPVELELVGAGRPGRAGRR